MSGTKPDNDAPVDVDRVLEDLAPEALEGLELCINPDGSVTFIDFPPELLEVAYALNPDDPLVCERRALLDGGEAPESDD